MFGGAAGPSKKTLFITLYPNVVSHVEEKEQEDD
jgi:hypothetical protein